MYIAHQQKLLTSLLILNIVARNKIGRDNFSCRGVPFAGSPFCFLEGVGLSRVQIIAFPRYYQYDT